MTDQPMFSDDQVLNGMAWGLVAWGALVVALCVVLVAHALVMS